MQMRAAPKALEPGDDRLSALVFDRLVRLDENGRPQPWLALDWQHDSEQKRWRFRLRPDIKFHDGTPLSPGAVAESLQAVVSGDSVVFQFERPAPALLFEVAGPSGSVLRRAPDGSAIGSGPFRVTSWEAQRRAVLAADVQYWGGRAFLDSIEIEFGRPHRDQAIDLELGKADVVEISAAELRRLNQRGTKTWTSRPAELLAVVAEMDNSKLREAVAFSIDRAAIHSVLFQRQGEVAGGLLPQWLSGYAFLFPTGRDLERARRAAAQASPRPLALAYDSSDPAGRLVADRIAVNAREAGLTLRVVPQPGIRPDLNLVRRRIISFSPARALHNLAASLGLKVENPAMIEEAYESERGLMETNQIIPLLHLPTIYGLGPRVRNWREGRLEEVWLEAQGP